MPRPHPPEFRRRAVELAREKIKPICHLAKDLGSSESCLCNWVALADVDEGRRDGVTSADRADQRRQLRIAEMENEILRRAAAYLRPGERSPKMIYSGRRPAGLHGLHRRCLRQQSRRELLPTLQL
jgi:transposase